MEQGVRDWLRETVELTARKKDLLKEILQLTAAQAGLLEPGQVQELLTLVKQRQKYVDDITVIEAELLQTEAKILDACGITFWPAGKTVYNSDWQKIDALRRDIQALLRETQILDKSNRQAISTKCEELKISIKSLRDRKVSLKAYHVTALQPDGYFIDQKK
ncbi:flagellar export chaperone FlgN [Pelotomaculum schinkii]|uniref:flagellar export chaperone FlgN n=1 Tax=Pelotomaculum schinkii TaxID=78350 RepID=UPI00167C8D6B|nr:flagellar export chaperone FlgN [Pelotomaculum schinkii]